MDEKWTVITDTERGLGDVHQEGARVITDAELLFSDSEMYGVAIISRLLKMIGLFCRRALEKRLYSAKETYNLKEPTNRNHPIHEEGARVHHFKGSGVQHTLHRTLLQHTLQHTLLQHTLQHTLVPPDR